MPRPLQCCASGHTWRPMGPTEDAYGFLLPAVTECPVCVNGGGGGHRQKGEDYWREKAEAANMLLAQGLSFSKVCQRLRVGRIGLRSALQSALSGEGKEKQE